MDVKLVALAIVIPLVVAVSNAQALSVGHVGVCRVTVYYTGYRQQTIYGQTSRQTCSGGSWFRRRRCSTVYTRTVSYRRLTQRLSRISVQCCSGYRQFGSICQPLCSPVCLNSGSCTRPNTCTCPSTYTGSRCQSPVCACQNGGTCVAPFRCSCRSGWTGLQCSQAVCTRPCQNGGACNRPNTCTCALGWTGPQCQTAICSRSCLNGGTCSRPNTCSCPHGWTGAQCQTPVCSSPCQNGGRCTRPNTCSCASGWTGATCGTPVCDPVCANGGLCIRPNTCSCSGPWVGTRCQQPTCTPACLNGGRCTKPNTCSCPETWTGANCQYPVCSPTCQNGGTCIRPDTCRCPSGWNGAQCQQPICSRACENDGNCVAPDTCRCAAEWTGPACKEPVCSPSCRNGGTCARPGQCHCLSGWSGDHCHQHFCSPGCENGGTCSGPLTCDCSALWEGSYCQTSVCPTPCANGGTCVGRDSCSCTPGWTGGHCQSETYGCAKGTYYDVSTKCEPCPLAYYQDENNQLSCKRCPGKTKTNTTGGSSLADCKRICRPGEYSVQEDGLAPCLPCPKDTWQSEQRASVCIKCDYAKFTLKVGTEDASECAPCPPGTIFNPEEYKCTQCPYATYQRKSGQLSCRACPENKYTRRKGSQFRSHCLDKVCSLFCHPGVDSCRINAIKRVICGPCPQGWTGNGYHCYTIPTPSLAQAGIMISSISGEPCHPWPLSKPIIVNVKVVPSSNNPFLLLTRFNGTAKGVCIPNNRKRSTGHVVLQFTIETPIPFNCTGDCIKEKLQSLRAAAFQVFNVMKSGSLQVTLTFPSGVTSQPILVNPHPVWNYLGQTCESGAVFRDNQCVPCSPGFIYSKESNECHQVWPRLSSHSS